LSAKALQRATGMLRTEVGKHLRIRLTPTLEFVPDALPETAGEIERLLGEAKQRDEAVRQAASGAHYAGEENPYKADDEDH
jgi:ribosome-binding factor A